MPTEGQTEMKNTKYKCKDLEVGNRGLYRVINKSVKHFKNSQQINYASDLGSSYADRE
jgi:hypothetical protein